MNAAESTRAPGGGSVCISVVIPTYNRSARLAALLDSLARQTFRPEWWEIVVADNNSTDDTALTVERFAAAYPHLCVRRVVEMRPGVSSARNKGISESRGEVIVALDDDETAVSELLEAYWEVFSERPDAAAAGGRITASYERGTPAWMSHFTERAIAGVLDFGPRVREFPAGRFFGGGNLAMRRTVFDTVGKFDATLGRTGQSKFSSEEKELFFRIRRSGAKIYYVPRAEIFHHISPDRLTAEYLRRICLMNGASERKRTLGRSRAAYVGKLGAEGVKWGATLLLAAGHILAGHGAKGAMLVRMRVWISRGLLGAPTA